MNLDYSKKVMLKVINDKPQLGKTAVMKIMFILQQVYNMNLGYDFNIYTYGPYAAEVTNDLEMLIYDDFVDAEAYEYKNSMAYNLRVTKQGRDSINMLSSDDEKKISDVLTLFGNKTAKELELDSTIIYTKSIYTKNNWQEIKEEIIDDVHEIKPHFTIDAIQSAYDRLEKDDILVFKR